MKKIFLNVNDVAECMDISVPMAYKIIKKLTDGLSSRGFITISGYFRESKQNIFRRKNIWRIAILI